MSKEQFDAIMPYICADLIKMISTKKNISESSALLKLYMSKLYVLLAKEETKVWQYSTETFFLYLNKK